MVLKYLDAYSLIPWPKLCEILFKNGFLDMPYWDILQNHYVGIFSAPKLCWQSERYGFSDGQESVWPG